VAPDQVAGPVPDGHDRPEEVRRPEGSGRVVVVGSLNHDVVAAVPRWLAPGETLLATGLVRGNGGKGGNQAIAAALVGAPVTMVGAVGADLEGEAQSRELAAHGIDTTSLLASVDVPTSLALVTVVPDGENTIVVTPGANDLLTRERVGELLDGLHRADRSGVGPAPGSRPGADVALVLAQSEIGAPGCDAAATFAVRVGARFVLSNGPVAAVSRDTWAACDPVVVNVHEARDVLRSHGVVTDAVADDGLARAVREATGARSVVVTLGRHGSVVGPVDRDPTGAAARVGGEGAQGAEAEVYVHVAAERAASVVDTTGAGDAYGGTLAARLALGATLVEACRSGSRAGALAVGWVGARPPSEG